jgi:predicted AAA+ superfamily ATPase
MDIGLRNAKLNFRQQEKSHLMEKVIFVELIRRGYSVDVGVIPFLLEEAGRII